MVASISRVAKGDTVWPLRIGSVSCLGKNVMEHIVGSVILQIHIVMRNGRR